MRRRALSIHTAAIALAAICFADTAGAGLVLCGDVTAHESVQSHCGDEGNKKNKLRIDDLFNAEIPAPIWVLLGDWNGKLKSGAPKRDDHLFHLWHPFLLSSAWSPGAAFAHDGRWAQAQLHSEAPKQNVPEPGCLALLGIGLVGAALSRRHKRIKTCASPLEESRNGVV
jgi:hypothetical protein